MATKVECDWRLGRLLAAASVAWILLASNSIAQFEIPGESGGFSLNVDKPVELQAAYQLAGDKKTGKLSIAADIQPNWHIYSITQPQGWSTQDSSCGPTCASTIQADWRI